MIIKVNKELQSNNELRDYIDGRKTEKEFMDGMKMMNSLYRVEVFYIDETYYVEPKYCDRSKAEYIGE